MNLFGMHDYSPDWANMVIGAGRTGWAVNTEAIGCDPNDRSGKVYNTHDGKIAHITRLNNGYGSAGTIPLPERYADFAKRCANFVAASNGCDRWIIGNEALGLEWEWPDGQRITLSDYCRCFSLCRDAILGVRPGSIVIPQAPAPWNVNGKYPGNEAGDWVDQLRDMLRTIGVGNVDAIALHTYSHGHDPALIQSEKTMDPPFNHRRYHFRTYVDYMDAIPDEFRGLPVYITECNPDGWSNANNGWIQAAYAEIDRWNQGDNQQIHCLCFYRWPNEDREQFWINSKGEVVNDFRQSLANDYKPREVAHATIAPASKFKALDILNARMSPGTVNKDSWDVVGSIKQDEIVEFLGNKATKDGIEWMQVKSSAGLVCWVAYKLQDGSSTLSPV